MFCFFDTVSFLVYLIVFLFKHTQTTFNNGTLIITGSLPDIKGKRDNRGKRVDQLNCSTLRFGNITLCYTRFQVKAIPVYL